jgi:hypothetical protein
VSRGPNRRSRCPATPAGRARPSRNPGRTRHPVVGNETARDESGCTNKDDEIPRPPSLPRGAALRDPIGLLVAAGVFIDLLQVFALGGLVVGQPRPVTSQLTHEAKLPLGLGWTRLTRLLGAPGARAARRASGLAEQLRARPVLVQNLAASTDG